LSARLGGDGVSGFARASEPREFVFPVDHGPHPDYRNEWWYLTGNLETKAGRRFGYQVTFFRIALAPPSSVTETRPSSWATRQVWMAHVALSDVEKQRHEERERFARGAAGLAGARAAPFRVWLEDWQLQGTGDGRDQDWELQIKTDRFAFDFTLQPLTPIVLQGDAGLSRKSAEPGNASYYYSIPRLRTEGAIRVGEETHQVSGLSWLDREWSTSVLGKDQVGWDWFALQLDDGRDLMYYQLRRADGQPDPHSGGVLVGADGTRRRLGTADVGLEPQRWWHSADGVGYPVAWRLQLSDGSDFRIEAVFDDQRMDTMVQYWEGMVDVVDAKTGETEGRGYLELAGYE
jgi:predicted secreted hydrolase